jgi:hypothetical protein
VLFGSFRPGSKLGPRRTASRDAIRSKSSDASVTFYESKTKLCHFKLKGAAQGVRGNAYKMILFRSGSNRFSFRLWDPAGTLLATVTASGGAANLPALIASNGTVGPLVTMSIRGTISAGTDAFSSGVNIGDARNFRGGS